MPASMELISCGRKDVGFHFDQPNLQLPTGYLGREQNAFHLFGEINKNKVTFMMEIILAALIDQAYKIVPFRPWVRNCFVYFPRDQRGFASFIVDTENKFLFHGGLLIQVSLDLQVFFADSMRLASVKVHMLVWPALGVLHQMHERLHALPLFS